MKLKVFLSVFVVILGLAAGVYFLRVKAGGLVHTRRVVVAP